MPTLSNTKIYGNGISLPEPGEITGTFSITKDGLHFEIVKSDKTYSFKIFDLITTKLIHSGEVIEV